MQSTSKALQLIKVDPEKPGQLNQLDLCMQQYAKHIAQVRKAGKTVHFSLDGVDKAAMQALLQALQAADPRAGAYLVRRQTADLGFIIVEQEGNYLEFSYALLPQFRGQGVCTAMVRALTQQVAPANVFIQSDIENLGSVLCCLHSGLQLNDLIAYRSESENKLLWGVNFSNRPAAIEVEIPAEVQDRFYPIMHKSHLLARLDKLCQRYRQLRTANTLGCKDAFVKGWQAFIPVIQKFTQDPTKASQASPSKLALRKV